MKQECTASRAGVSDCPTLSNHSSEDRANASQGEDWSGGRASTATAQPLTLGKRLQAVERVGAKQAPCPQSPKKSVPTGPRMRQQSRDPEAPYTGWNLCSSRHCRDILQGPFLFLI